MFGLFLTKGSKRIYNNSRDNEGDATVIVGIDIPNISQVNIGKNLTKLF